MVIFLVLYLLFIFKKTKYSLPILICLGVISSIYLFKNNQLKPLSSGKISDIFMVEDCQDNRIILKGKTKVVVYLAEYDLVPGDQIEASLEVKQLAEPSYTGDFDEKNYYRTKGVTNRAVLKNYQKVGHQFSFNQIKWHILQFYKGHLGEKNYLYLKTLIFGQNSLEDTIKKSYANLYSTHLLAISGLHILFLFHILKAFFQKIFRIEGEVASLFLIAVYLSLIGFPASACRAFLFLLLGVLNKGELTYTKLDLLAISFIVMIIINPFWAYQQGFILSFLVSFLLLFMNEFQAYKGIKGKFFTSLICILSTLPFVINQSYELSLTGLLLSFLVSFVLSNLLIPFVFFTLCCPFVIFEVFFIGIDRVLLALDQLKLLIPIPALSFPKIMIYYLFFLLWLIALVKKKKRVFLSSMLVFYLFGLSFLCHLNPCYQVTFIDVGQGDSILIKTPFSKEVILIDTFSNLDYLKSISLNQIDYVILSHLDSDHSKTIDEVVRLYHPRCIYYPYFESEERLKTIPCKKTKIKGKNEIHVGELTIEILGPIRNYNDANANSVVCKIKMNNTTFLFTGDMTIEAEEELLKIYKNELKADILKVGHHGSDTSSSIQFLNAVSPSVSIISVGEDNPYHLPNPVIYNRLSSKSTVYMTKDAGNINIYVGSHYQIYPYRK